MIIGRLLAGIGIGISSAIVPLYISEVVYVYMCMCILYIVYCIIFWKKNILTVSLLLRSHQLKFVVPLDL